MEFTDDPKIVVSNKEGRVEGIKKDFEKLVKKRVASGQELANLRGRMMFSNSQYYGRVGATAFRVLNKVDVSGGPKVITEEVKEAMRWWFEAVEDAPPREITFNKPLPQLNNISNVSN